MIYLLNVKEILILSNDIYLFTKTIIIRGIYILTRNYIHFKEPYQFVHGNQRSLFNEIYSFREIISIQGNICSFKEHIFVHVQDHIYVHSRKLYLLNVVAFAE